MTSVTSARCCHNKFWLATVQVVSLLAYSLFARFVHLKLEPRNLEHLFPSPQGILTSTRKLVRLPRMFRSQGEHSAWLEWFFLLFEAMKLRFHIYWVKEPLCTHPYGVSTWQFPRQWQLHGGQAILKLTFPHTDLEMLVNGTVLLLQQILKQLLSVLSVYIFASFPHVISCPQNFPAQGNTTLGFT